MSKIIKDVKHPLQPDWVITDTDVNVFLAFLDTLKPDMEDERMVYPPYICYLFVNGEGEENLRVLYSKWYGEYEPEPEDGEPNVFFRNNGSDFTVC